MVDTQAPAATTRRPRAARRHGLVAWGVLALGAVAAVVLHRLAAWSYPTPWPDESHFLAPALSLVTSGTLAVPQLHAPEGIFWMTDGYAVFLAGVFAVLPATLATARAASLAAAVVFAVAVQVVGVRLGGRRIVLAAAVALWLVAPRVVLLSDIARMEALVLALAGGALVAAARDRWPLALALAAAAPLVHPTGVLVLVAVVVPVLVWRLPLRPRRAEVAVLAAVAVGLAAEAWRFLTHLDLARAHLAYQFGRKANRPLVRLDPPGLVVLALSAAGGLWSLLRRPVDDPDAPVRAAVFGVAGALGVVHLVGQEMWYEVLGVETAALLAGVGLWCGRAPLRGRWLPSAAAAGAVAAAVILTVPLGYEHWGLRLDPGSRAEWTAFWDDATAQLHDLDATLDEPALVVVDYLSGFGPLLAREDFSNLRFVQPTQVTGAPRVSGAYSLYTPTAPPAYRWGIEQRLPATPPVVSVDSAAGTFALRVYAGGPVR